MLLVTIIHTLATGGKNHQKSMGCRKSSCAVFWQLKSGIDPAPWGGSTTNNKDHRGISHGICQKSLLDSVDCGNPNKTRIYNLHLHINI